MKHKLPWTLALTVLAVGIALLWLDDSPSTEGASTPGTVKGSPREAVEARPLFGPGQRDTMARDSSGGRDSGAARTAAKARGSGEFQDSDTAPTDAAASKPRRPASAAGDAAEFPAAEESEKTVIGGRVQDEQGNPQSGIEVLAERVADPAGADAAAGDVQSSFTDSEGAFLFENLKDGEYEVRLAPLAGMVPAQAMVRGGALNVTLTVMWLRDIRVHGTVSSTDAEPIEGVHIIVGPTTRTAKSGSEGEYEIAISRQGDNVAYNIHFQHEGFEAQRIRLDTEDLDELTNDLRLDVSMEPLERLTSVSGSLTDTEGRPVGGKMLHILTPQMQTKYSAESYESGYFLFEHVEPGEDYRLSIRPGSGYKNKDINPLVVPNRGLKLDVVLEPVDRGELSGFMIDLEGNMVRGFSLTLHSVIATGQSVNVSSDQQGFFLVEDFPVGEALFRSGSYPVLMVQGLNVSPEPEQPIAVVLDTGRHVLQGWVMDGYGEPVAAASIKLDWSFRDQGLRSSSTRVTSSDRNGYFVFTELGFGAHKLQVSAAGFSVAERTVNVGVDPGETVVELTEIN